jgi:hypothetical protein
MLNIFKFRLCLNEFRLVLSEFAVIYKKNSSIPNSPLEKWAAHAKKNYIHPALNSSVFRPGKPQRLKMLLELALLPLVFAV